jgi:hypothetical protein
VKPHLLSFSPIAAQHGNLPGRAACKTVATTNGHVRRRELRLQLVALTEALCFKLATLDKVGYLHIRRTTHILVNVSRYCLNTHFVLPSALYRGLQLG